MDNVVKTIEGVGPNVNATEMVAWIVGDKARDHSSDQEREVMQRADKESANETLKDSVSSQGDSPTVKDDKVERNSRVPKNLPKKQSSENNPCAVRASADRQEVKKLQFKTLQSTPKSSQKTNKGGSERTAKDPQTKFTNMSASSGPPSESSEGDDDKASEEGKLNDNLDETLNGTQSIGTDGDSADTEENGLGEDEVHANQKIEEMELRIEKLEEELRAIAALEISLYSIVPEHGCSAHKVHTPARRLSRLYIHACKHWTLGKRASVARNTVSGLVLVAKSSGSDVPRLTFWWSNTVVLREIVSQTFGNSCLSSLNRRLSEFNGDGKRNEVKLSSLKWNGGAGSKQVKKLGIMHIVDDWQETSTFTSALQKIESWIFSRIIESVWWQILTPHMQSPVENLCSLKTSGQRVGSTLGDQQPGSFSINLWKSAFLEAFQRLCPVRAGGHECGCLPVLARLVMEQCVARLDVAMFNAILRESAHEMPTDPVSDPIVDSRVLPIPSGQLSFGSGAQLKNSIGNWSRWLTDLFAMDADDSLKGNQVNGKDSLDNDQLNGENVDTNGLVIESKSFRLLNALSDLLMLPKDMLVDTSIRKEVCPSLDLPLIKRILCNFIPDEFCPDPVPVAVLEILNSERLAECQLLDEDMISSFPCSAAPIVYRSPTRADVAEKVSDASGQVQLGRNASIIQRRGYTSDEELDELECPLTSIIDKRPSTPVAGNGTHEETMHHARTRYELLRQVWSM